MPAASLAEIKSFFGLEGVADERLQSLLVTAKCAVSQGGLSEGHESFRDLQLVYAGALLENAGLITGNVTSKSIGDVSISFGASSPAAGGLSWRGMYISMRNSILGFNGRFG